MLQLQRSSTLLTTTHPPYQSRMSLIKKKGFSMRTNSKKGTGTKPYYVVESSIGVILLKKSWSTPSDHLAIALASELLQINSSFPWQDKHPASGKMTNVPVGFSPRAPGFHENSDKTTSVIFNIEVSFVDCVMCMKRTQLFAFRKLSCEPCRKVD